VNWIRPRLEERTWQTSRKKSIVAESYRPGGSKLEQMASLALQPASLCETLGLIGETHVQCVAGQSVQTSMVFTVRCASIGITRVMSIWALKTTSTGAKLKMAGCVPGVTDKHSPFTMSLGCHLQAATWQTHRSLPPLPVLIRPSLLAPSIPNFLCSISMPEACYLKLTRCVPYVAKSIMISSSWLRPGFLLKFGIVKSTFLATTLFVKTEIATEGGLPFT